MEDTIKESVLKEIIRAGSPCSACVKGESTGFLILFTTGQQLRTLLSSRGSTRKFASLNTAMEFLKQLGIKQFQVDARMHEVGRLRKARPDRAEALKKTRTTPRQQELLAEIMD